MNQIILPDTVKGRNIHENIIPTVCNLRNMLEVAIAENADLNKLKSWEKRSYNSYAIEYIKKNLAETSPSNWKDILRKHIIQIPIEELRAHCIDIYLVAYVSLIKGPGRKAFIQYIYDRGISDKESSAQAIWQVGKGDGVYLELLNSDGSIRDFEFFQTWLNS